MRIVVNGVSGSGKSTLARRLGVLLDLPYVELDSLYHGADWTPRQEFDADVAAFAAEERWVTEFGYTSARPLLAERADLVVWLDPPTWLTMWQVTLRTISRRARRTELWNGNREAPLWRFLVDDEHVVRWAWRTRKQAAERIATLRDLRPELEVVRLRSRGEVEAWLAAISGGRPVPPR